MYMRYAGGGVGHYKVELSDPHDLESEFADDIAADNEELVHPNSEGARAEIAQEVPVLDNEGDADSSSDESEGGEGVPENDLPEDGEGGFVDPEDEEGYAEL